MYVESSLRRFGAGGMDGCGEDCDTRRGFGDFLISCCPPRFYEYCFISEIYSWEDGVRLSISAACDWPWTEEDMTQTSSLLKILVGPDSHSLISDPFEMRSIFFFANSPFFMLVVKLPTWKRGQLDSQSFFPPRVTL